MGFKVRDALVGEADVVADRSQPVGDSPVLLFQFADTLRERGVLRGDPDDVVLGPFRPQFADLSEEFGDLCALIQDLVLGRLERILGVQGPFSAGRFALCEFVVAVLDPSRPAARRVASSTSVRACGCS
ncbi:hypothetical protein ACF1GY_34995 [Streptomyces sp. NPDC014684]|uniref:hypothetical protein n=1 Tax=Streptomyces sp. NPDC014684 TaxID=3364880 RepID=UPI0036F53AFE